MGPVSFPQGNGVDVIPHPHINLATVTYLFEGELVHRDSLGSVQTITPGAVNLMMAGRGVVHSERTGPMLRSRGHAMNGLQLWCALPEEIEETEAAFFHYSASDLPEANIEGVKTRVMMGAAFGLSSPVKNYSPTLYAEAEIPGGGALDLPADLEDRAVYLVSGNLRVRTAELPIHCLVLFTQGSEVRLSADEDSHVVILGGNPLGKRYMWWNFVSSRRERIEKAKRDWKEGRFDKVPGETEFYPLPERDAFSEKEE
jgi:redox-sensitive bicupin YhaK (pirin superfamily)